MFKRGQRKCSLIRGQILPTRNRSHSKSICVPWPLNVKQAAKITFAQWKCRTFQSITYPTGKNLPPPFITIKPAALWMIECEIPRRRCWILSPIFSAPPPPFPSRASLCSFIYVGTILSESLAQTSSHGDQIGTENLFQPSKQTKGLVWFSSRKENIASRG